MLNGEILSALDDAELDRLAAIIDTGRRVRALRKLMQQYETHHGDRMRALHRQVREAEHSLALLRSSAGGAA